MARLSRREFLQYAAAAGMAAPMLAPSARSDSEQKPLNFVLILMDDMGWTDLGCCGSTFYETPNIDRLAKEGARFTSAYAACCVCSPTRAAVVTGKHPARLGLTDWIPGMGPAPRFKLTRPETLQRLPLEELTIAEALKAKGYVCSCIGKWHLGGPGFLPENQGFGVNVGGTASGAPSNYFYPDWKNNPPLVGQPGEYLTDRLSDEAVKFIESYKSKPFFLYLSHFAVHIPIQAKEAIIARYKAKARLDQIHNNPVYAAMIESVDQGIGRILAALEKQGIADRTVVMFTSDNGGLHIKQGPNTPATSNHPLRGGKGCLYEGGIREPFIIRWPGVVQPGRVFDQMVCSMDFYPTITEMAGIPKQPDAVIDGVSLVPLLRDAKPIRRDSLYWHYPHYAPQGGRPSGAIRRGSMKLVEHFEDGKLELFDLEADIGEKNDLAGRKPELVKELHQDLIAWRARVNAKMPTPNPDYAG